MGENNINNKENDINNKENDSSNNINFENISVEFSKGGFFEDILVSESFKISKEDGTVIEFKPTLVEKGLLIPMFRSDNVPYYQLIDFDSIDCIIERFLRNRLIFNKPFMS